MQLKTLKVKGFKSFADPTIIEFNKGVTAVVGPNGSGKSNVIEAIRWVMGEQSAKSLRGGRMNDVIFSGTSKRKPMNIAEVTLILDNSTGFLPIDFNEVSISRRLNRNGDSDYFINKQACRLKDIVELFMDSGLGKESFSIISQGQVESIFNSKPEDRRAIFEEAAGVFKYKMQKQEAKRKLEDTQGNLDRVQDILYELESQVEPLREQAERANHYVKLKEDLTDTDVGLSVMKINQYSDDLKETSLMLQELGKQIDELNQAMSQESEKETALKDKSQALTSKREDLQNQILELVQSIERTESALAIRHEKAKHKEEFLSSKRQSIAEQTERLNSLTVQINEKQETVKTLKETVVSIKTELNDKKERLGYLQEGTDERIEALRAEYIEWMQSKASLNNEEQSLKQRAHKDDVQLKRLKQKKSELQEQLSEETKELEDKQAKLETLSVELESLLSNYQKMAQKKQAVDQTIQQKQQELQEIKNKYERSKARYSSLKQMQDNYAGYFAGVKEIMQNKQQLNGIVGTVADLIKIPAEYLEAIDTVLGSNSQFIVVEDERAGREAIQYLKKHRSGRATFLPLTTIKPRYVQQQTLRTAQSQSGFIGVASELINYNKHVSNIIENLLGHTLVAEDLNSANQIARSINFRHRVVSLDGNVMNAGGSMTGGGSRSNNAHIFTQKEELEQLEKTIRALTKQIQVAQKGLEDSLNEQSELSDRLEEIKTAGEDKRYIENDLKNEVNYINDSVDQLAKQLKANDFEFNEMNREHEEAAERLKSLAKEKAEVSQKIELINSEMKDLTEAKKDSSNKQEELLGRIEEVTGRLAEAREQLVSNEATLSNLTDQYENGQAHLKRLETDIETYQSEESLGSEEELREQLNQMNETYDSLKLEDQTLRDEVNAVSNTLTELEQTMKNHQTDLQKLQSDQNKAEVKQSKLEVNLDYQLNYLVEEYTISYEEAVKLPPLDDSFDEASTKVKHLKNAIKQLGPVNLNAIEEYEQVSERYEFLMKQQKDLLDAKNQLNTTMDEMDNEVKTRFKESFNNIKAQFSKVFPQMFGGGKAELRLTDPDDLLTSGVDIVAQPPGKRLSSLSLLSGGERALTAISLLFSIIQVSPIPFCILDEAEAALDESNVARFGHYLQNFETDTQFIVITHRKGTMAQADSLYGITMQEKGVSKLVSVRFEDVEEMDLDD